MIYQQTLEHSKAPTTFSPLIHEVFQLARTGRVLGLPTRTTAHTHTHRALLSHLSTDYGLTAHTKLNLTRLFTYASDIDRERKLYVKPKLAGSTQHAKPPLPLFFQSCLQHQVARCSTAWTGNRRDTQDTGQGWVGTERRSKEFLSWGLSCILHGFFISYIGSSVFFSVFLIFCPRVLSFLLDGEEKMGVWCIGTY